jgi:hypothetical protein
MKKHMWDYSKNPTKAGELQLFTGYNYELGISLAITSSAVRWQPVWRFKASWLPGTITAM